MVSLADLPGRVAVSEVQLGRDAATLVVEWLAAEREDWGELASPTEELLNDWQSFGRHMR